MVSKEELDRFAAAPPPRMVPSSIRRRVLGSLVRGPVGVLLLAATALWIFPAIFFPWAALDDLSLDRGHRVVRGVVIEREATAMAGGRTNRKVVDPILRYRFSFRPSGGAEVHAACYSTDAALQAGQSVEVEHLAADPSVARLRGGRRGAYGLWGALTVLLPLAGYLAALLALGYRAHRKRLLVRGVLATATIDDVWATGTKVGGQQQHRVHVGFELEGTSYTTSCLVGEQEGERARAARRAGERARVLCDPRRPERVIVVDWLDSA
jgi:hypothetical protein